MSHMRNQSRMKFFCAFILVTYIGSAQIVGASSLAQYLDGPHDHAGIGVASTALMVAPMIILKF